MAKPTDKSLSQLKSQETNLENQLLKYRNSPKLQQAEQTTEQQIRAKGGTPNTNAKEDKMGAIKRRMAKNNGK